MKIRELIEELIKHDLDLEVYLINGNDLMFLTDVVDVRVKHTYTQEPEKFDETEFCTNKENSPYPNAILIHWT